MVVAVDIAFALMGVLFLAIAGIVAWLGRRSPLHWTLATLLFVRGAENIVQGAGPWVNSYSITPIEFGLEATTTVLFALFAIEFGMTYGDRQWRRWMIPVAVGGALFIIIESVPGLAHDPWGADFPLSLIGWWVSIPIRIIASFIVLRVAIESKKSTVQASGALISMGMLVFSAWFVGTTTLIGPLDTLENGAITYIDHPLQAAILWGATILGAVAMIRWWMRARTVHPMSAKWGLRIAYVGLLVGAIPTALGPGWELLVDAGDLLFVLAQPILLAFGMLRFQVLGLDMRVQKTIKSSTLAGMFIGIFVAVSQIGGAWLEDEFGSSVIGVVATGFLLLAFSPLKKLAERVSKAAVPDAQPVDAMADETRRELYVEQLEFAWANGVLDRIERQRLAKLRERLSISADLAMELEANVLDADPKPAAA